MLNKLLRRIEKWFGRNHLRQLSDGKASYIKKFVLASQNIPGELAEVGVSIGDSASIICENKEHRPLHLFDTFTGHPEEWIGRYDIGQTAGRHAATMESVQERLKRYPNVHFYQGIFPETSTPIKNKVFSFVHLDTDLYRSTKEGLEFFFPRMSVGGVICVDDSAYILGVGCAIIDALEEQEKRWPYLQFQSITVVKMNQAFIKRTK